MLTSEYFMTGISFNSSLVFLKLRTRLLISNFVFSTTTTNSTTTITKDLDISQFKPRVKCQFDEEPNSTIGVDY